MCEVKYKFGIKVKEDLTILEKNNIVPDEVEEAIVKYMDENPDLFISIDELGISEEDLDNPEYYQIVGDNEDMEDEILDNVEEGLVAEKIFKLYRYVVAPQARNTSGYNNGIGPNTRPFCRELSVRSNLSLLTKDSIQRLNSSNPGFGIRGANTYSVFNWRGGVNCKHIWVKYLFQPSTNSLVKSPNNQQPTQTSPGSVPRYNR